MLMQDNWTKYIEKFNRNDEEVYSQMFPNGEALNWIEAEVPKFECPDKIIEETYYFRWWTFRKHIKEIPEGRIITEFLPDVYWAEPYNSINCASGHHIAEARWLKKDKKLVREYIDFWLRGKGNVTSYSSWLIYSIYQYALVSDNKEYVLDFLPEMIKYYKTVEISNLTKYGLFWSYDDRDGMEMSISGSGLRPTLNSYMYANAYALARMSKWAGDKEIIKEYESKALELKKKICEFLWDETDEFFKVVPQKNKIQKIDSFSFEDISVAHNVREAIGYIPWEFSIPNTKHDIAWKYLSDKRYFKAEYGPTTAERRHPKFMESNPDHECMWNGSSWPFSTTQILNSMIIMLQQGRREWVTEEEFLELVHIYANSHYRRNKFGDLVNWIDESIDPDSGEWISRNCLEKWGWREDKGGYERGKDYNHSAFCDVVIRGICGIELNEERRLCINPLIPKGKWDYFMLEELPYKNHKVTIGYDCDGIRYQKGKGLWVELDGKVIGQSASLSKLSVGLEN